MGAFRPIQSATDAADSDAADDERGKYSPLNKEFNSIKNAIIIFGDSEINEEKNQQLDIRLRTHERTTNVSRQKKRCEENEFTMRPAPWNEHV